MLKLRELFGRKPKQPSWHWEPKDLPWYEQPDANQRLEERRKRSSLSDSETALLQQWQEQGYCILPGAISHEEIDAMVGDVEALWTADDVKQGLSVHDLVMREGEAPATVPHEQVVALSAEDRIAVRNRSIWRIHGLNYHSDNARRIYENPMLTEAASLIFDQPAAPVFTINFMYGSRQALHQDSCVFHISPPQYVMGAWLACEDITADSGPLVYYPGSHREPIFPGFDNYPQTNLRTMPKDRMKEYYDYVSELSQKYERHQFLARKGDVLLWHGMLIHGGDEVTNPASTRKSYVCHYIPPGMDKSMEVQGPFNW